MPPKSPLPLLIRQSKLMVDERQRELAELREQENKAEQALRAHDQRLLYEQEALSSRPMEAISTFSDWKKFQLNQRVQMADMHGKLSRSREAAQSALQDAVADLKRLELAEEARQKEIKRAAERKAETKIEEIETIRRLGNPSPDDPT